MDHRRFFAEFCKWELASGGPDPQLAMVNNMASISDLTEEERLWRGLCYIAVYNVPYGEIMWLNLPLSIAVHRKFRPWLNDEFAAGRITTRIERRSVRRADWMEDYLIGALRFLERDWMKLKRLCDSLQPEDAYEVAWDSVTAMPRVGRYAAIKLIEYLRRYHKLNVSTPDIRPKDAWSPRHTLGYLFPDRGLGNRDNSSEAIYHATRSCMDAIHMLRDTYNVEIDMFQLQVLLCEYRESWESKKQYPGRSLDSELGYVRRAEHEWGHTSAIWNARKQLFPIPHLGELNGWDGPRKNVAQCLATHGYTWTDLLYDYKSTVSMDHPRKWTDA